MRNSLRQDDRICKIRIVLLIQILSSCQTTTARTHARKPVFEYFPVGEGR